LKNPLVDSNTLVAIETLFRKGTKDPWAVQLLSAFTNLYIYADTFRFTMPLPDTDNLDHTKQPQLVNALLKENSRIARPERYSTDHPLEFDDGHLQTCLDDFLNWTYGNPNRLRKWLDTHFEEWVRHLHHVQIRRAHVFDLDRIKRDIRVREIARIASVSEDKVCYGLDNVLRYSIYGEMTGPDEHYLHHPVRDAFPIPTMQTEPIEPHQLPIDWGPDISSLASRGMRIEELAGLLQQIRTEVRERHIRDLPPDLIEPEIKREIAASVRLPAHLRGIGPAGAIASGLLAAATTFPALGGFSTLAGAAVTVSLGIWKGRLPRLPARIRWIPWIRWDVETRKPNGERHSK